MAVWLPLTRIRLLHMRLPKDPKRVDQEEMKNIPFHGFYYTVCRSVGARTRLRDQHWPRVTISLFCFILSASLIVFYYWPDEFVRSPLGREQRPGSLIVFIQTLTDLPVWSILFSVAASSLLLIFFFRHEWMPWAHFINSIVMFIYSGSIWYGAFLAQGTYVVTAAFASFVVVVNFSLAISYAENPLK